MKFSQTIFISISILVIAGGVGSVWAIASRAMISMPHVVINGHTVRVEIADTPAAQLQGLSGRTSLCDQCGMLFIYAEAQRRPFWMKDMLFPIDFVWIRDAQIVDMSLHVPPPAGNAEPITIIPHEPVTHILEVPAGTIARFGWQVGDRIEMRR